MKKISILFALVLTTIICGAQTRQKTANDMVRINQIQNLAVKSTYEHRMVSFRSDDNYESSNFSYDNHGRLIAVREYVAGEYEVIDSISYNDQNQLVKISGWQKMGATWKNVYYVDYTYDVAGNIASRTNYNNMSDGWTMGGIYTYTYNDNHQIVLTVLHMMNILYQKIEYTYDSYGQLADETWYNYNGYGVSPDEKITYYYSNGKLDHTQDSTTENDGATWDYNGEELYVYDQYGNVTEYHRFNRGGAETGRSEYEFNYDMPLSTTQMPWHPEIERPKSYTFNNVHAMTTEHWYTVDVDWVLQYVCDYFYYYDDYVSIAERHQPTVNVYPNPTEGRLTIQAEQVINTYVFNAMGQLVKTFGATNEIDLSNMANGIYTLRVKTQNGTAFQQVVLQ